MSVTGLASVVFIDFPAIMGCVLLIVFVSDRDMAARHRARANSVQIMRVQPVKAKDCRRTHVQQFHVSFALRATSKYIRCSFSGYGLLGLLLAFV